MNLLLLGCVCAAFGLARGVRVHNLHPQTSIPLSGDTGSPDLPLDAPPLARTAKGFEPEGIHLTQWTADSVLVSWQTGEERLGSGAKPPPPHDPTAVPALVLLGTAPGRYARRVRGRDSLVYSYRYGEDAGDTVYRSPVLHHVLLAGLRPGTTYFYRVGNGKHGWSGELSFATPAPTFPFRLGVLGDPGQTRNTTVTLQHLLGNKPDLALLVGDFSYADDHESGNTSTTWSFGGSWSTHQPRWDAWARLTQPLLAAVPLVSCRGNHEVEMLRHGGGDDGSACHASHKAANARYPYPQDPAVLGTGEERYGRYLNASNLRAFVREAAYRPRGAFYSLDLPGLAHVVSLNNYIPWGRESAQYRWLQRDLAQVNRTATPWLIVTFHAAVYHTYEWHYKEGDTWLALYEPLLHAAGVDLVFSGHVHAYERTTGVFQYRPDECGPMYTTVGDGGNIEGLVPVFIEAAGQPFCANASLFELPSYQPTPGGATVRSLQDGAFCPDRQPAWSAFRQPSFGHGVLELQSATRAVWQWHRNTDAGPVVADEATIIRGLRECPGGARAGGEPRARIRQPGSGGGAAGVA